MSRWPGNRREPPRTRPGVRCAARGTDRPTALVPPTPAREGDHRQGMPVGAVPVRPSPASPVRPGTRTADQCPRPIPELGVRALTHPHPTPVRTQGQTDRVGKGEVGAGCEGVRRRRWATSARGDWVASWLDHGAAESASSRLPRTCGRHPQALPVWDKPLRPEQPGVRPRQRAWNRLQLRHPRGHVTRRMNACNLRRTLAHVTCAIMVAQLQARGPLDRQDSGACGRPGRVR